MAKKGRRKAMNQEEVDELPQTIAVATKANRGVIFDKPAAPVEQVQRNITSTTTRVFVAEQFLAPLPSEQYWTINYAD